MFLEDKSKSAGVKPDPFTLDSLISWLLTKNPEEQYCWLSTGECLFGQYGRHLGFGKYDGAAYLAALKGFNHRAASGDVVEPFNGLAMDSPHTFGGALNRALAIKAKSP